MCLSSQCPSESEGTAASRSELTREVESAPQHHPSRQGRPGAGQARPRLLPEPGAVPGEGGRAAAQVPALRACAVPAPPGQVRSTPSRAAAFSSFPAAAIRDSDPRTSGGVASQVLGEPRDVLGTD